MLPGIFQEFYQAIYTPAGGNANWLNWGAAHMNMYDMSDPPPRLPTTAALALALGGEAASVTPAEVSVVLSFQGDEVSGAPQARRRGRVYLGGFAIPCSPSAASNPPRVDTTLVNQIENAASELRSDIAAASMSWVVYSPTYDLETEVTNGWIDNEPDTQRRRGVQATLRTLWPS